MFGALLSRIARVTRRALPHVSHSLISLIAERVMEAQSEGGSGELRTKRALTWSIGAIEWIAGRDLVDDTEFVDAVGDVQRAIYRLYCATRRCEHVLASKDPAAPVQGTAQGHVG